MVHLLQVVTVLVVAILFLVGGVLIYTLYYNPAANNVSEIIEIITNQSGFSSAGVNSSGVGGGGGVVVVDNGTSTTPPLNITLPSNVQILQNEINDTRYTAILIVENLTA